VTPEEEIWVRALEDTGRYRVLRQLEPRNTFSYPGDAETRLGIILDVETTGMNTARDEIIELAMLPFTFTGDGRVVEAKDTFRRLRQPSIPIPPEITKLTGIDDAAVSGRIIDPGEVAAIVDPAAVIIAHHAEFDRPFAERFCDAFIRKAWACSATQIDWAAAGYEGKKLSYLCSEAGFYYDRHRAAQDCAALLELLSRRLPGRETTTLHDLLTAARQPDCRIWAINSSFELKDVLKGRGYRWSDGSNGLPKSWFTTVPEAKCDEEIAWLHKEIYRRPVELRVDRLTCFNRFSGVRA
jgi:DNA polymerase-3 subunit epsilon